MGGDHHVRRVEELDNRFDGQIRAGRRRSEKHHGLGRRELLPLGALGRKEPRGAKYGTTAMPSPSPTVGGGDEEDARRWR